MSNCVYKFKRQGLNAYMLEQPRKVTGVRVVRAMVPGLRPFWARFGRGRLYDVPVKMGWAKAERREWELNPAHVCV